MVIQSNLTLGGFGLILNGAGEIFLCLRNDKPIWNLPGGRVEHGESPWTATKREVFEETGIIVIVIELVAVDFDPVKNDLSHYFLCSSSRLNPVRSSESCDFGFFSQENLPANCYERHKNIVLRYLTEKSCFFMNTSRDA